MPTIICLEEAQSRTINLDEPSIELRYKIIKRPTASDQAAIDHNDAIQKLLLSRPPIMNLETIVGDLMPGSDIRLEPDTKYSMIATVPYRLAGSSDGLPDPEELEDESPVGNLSFSASAESKHITLALFKVNSYNAPGIPNTDYKNVIGLDSDNNIGGTDIPSHKLSWTETHYKPLAFVTHDYVTGLGQVVGRTCNAEFRGKPGYSVLCMSVQGSINWDKLRWELTFVFEYAPRETVKIGDIPEFGVDGYDYVDVHYEVKEDATGFRTVARPIQADVLFVIRSGDFATLGIGVDP